MINDFKQESKNIKLRLKKDIKKTSGNCTRILLILVISIYIIGFLITLAIEIKARILGLDTTMVISRDAKTFFVGYLPCIIGDIIAIIFAIKTTNIKLKENIFRKNTAPKVFILLGTISCIGTGMISSIIYFTYATIFQMGGITIPQPDFSFPTQKGYLILFLIYVCLLGPILEEIIFRGFILKSMQKYGNLTAVIVSSILFSMFHLNLVQFVNPVLMGTVLAFIAIKSKSIFPSIIAHIFNNTITFIIIGMPLFHMPLLEYISIIIYPLIGILSLGAFIFKYRKDFIETIKEDTRILKTYEKIKYSFTGIWSLVYIAFYVIYVGGAIVVKNII